MNVADSVCIPNYSDHGSPNVSKDVRDSNIVFRSCNYQLSTSSTIVQHAVS